MSTPKRKEKEMHVNEKLNFMHTLSFSLTNRKRTENAVCSLAPVIGRVQVHAVQYKSILYFSTFVLTREPSEVTPSDRIHIVVNSNTQ